MHAGPGHTRDQKRQPPSDEARSINMWFAFAGIHLKHASGLGVERPLESVAVDPSVDPSDLLVDTRAQKLIISNLSAVAVTVRGVRKFNLKLQPSASGY